MESNENVGFVQSLISKFPLEDILNTAESILEDFDEKEDNDSAHFKVLLWVVKALKMLVKVQPAAASVSGFIEAIPPKNAGAETPGHTQLDKAKPETPEIALFNRLWAVAKEDNIITFKEQEFLRPHALAAGISEEEFERMVCQ